MNQNITQGIVLTRTNFGEADRIITFLTPDYGKLRLMARGARRVKSKLAGGIELFSVSDITFIRGRGDIGTLVSARLRSHYANIVRNLERTMLGYELIKKLNKITEDETESEYFYLLEQAFVALDDSSIEAEVVKLWFTMQLLRLGGHTPNLHTDEDGQLLKTNYSYQFDFDHMAFIPKSDGQFSSTQIKFLRIGFSGNNAKILQKVQDSIDLTRICVPLVNHMDSTLLRD